MSINRDQFLQEQLLREYIRKRLITKDTQRVIEEQQFRKAIRKLLIEAEATDEVPAESTGINVLADLLKKIVPTLEDGYKNLTTDKEQRDSYRAHIVNAVKRTIAPVDAQEDAAKKESMEYFYDRVLLEKIAINIGDEEGEEEEVEGEFIDIEGDEAAEGEEFGLEGKDETGRNFASSDFDRIEKQIVDAYTMLGNDEDKKQFYDYLLTNLMLYFDKFEDELQETLPQTTTPEYEEAKAEEGEEGEEAAEDEGGEEAAEEEPAEEGEEGGEEALDALGL
tara:strand:- start:158 stop:994 length:837 start_codon:yes stop_codon:yes gene_type:complete